VTRRSKSVHRRRNSIKIILISAALIGLVALGVRYYMQTVPSSSRTTFSSSSQTTFSSSSQTTVRSSSQIVTYVTHSSPTSQWLVLSFSQPPANVTASNTGLIPRFLSSESLNATKIGVYCEQTVTSESTSGSGGSSPSGVCVQFMTYQQTGWYWDLKSELLFIHYLGGPSVQISVVVGENVSS